MSRLVFVALIAIYHLQALNAIDPECSGDGNLLCSDADGNAIVCGCKGDYPCPSGQWFDPAVKDCSWSRDLLFRLINCLPDSSSDTSEGSQDNFCQDMDDGNYPCDSSDLSKLCACYNGKLCPNGQWYDSSNPNCIFMTQDMLDKLNSCLAPSEETPNGAPAPPAGGAVCPADWLTVGTYCYKAILEGKPYDQALQRCVQEDKRAHLAYVLTSDQNDALVQYLQQYKGTEQCFIHQATDTVFYTSGQRIDQNSCDTNDFTWQVDSTKTIPLSGYSNWKTGEPNCYQGRQENCLTYRCLDDGNTCFWNDYLCTFTGCLLCQIDL